MSGGPAATTFRKDKFNKVLQNNMSCVDLCTSAFTEIPEHESIEQYNIKNSYRFKNVFTMIFSCHTTRFLWGGWRLKKNKNTKQHVFLGLCELMRRPLTRPHYLTICGRKRQRRVSRTSLPCTSAFDLLRLRRPFRSRRNFGRNAAASVSWYPAAFTFIVHFLI